MNTSRVSRVRTLRNRQFSLHKLSAKKTKKKLDVAGATLVVKKKQRKLDSEKNIHSDGFAELPNDADENPNPQEDNMHRENALNNSGDEIRGNVDNDIDADLGRETNIRSEGFPSPAASSHELEFTDFVSGIKEIPKTSEAAAPYEDEFTGPTFKMEVKKDIAAFFKQTSGLTKSVKEIKSLLQGRKMRDNSPTSRYSTSDEEIKFALLPDFELTKVWQVKKMEENVNENRAYAKQLVG